VHPIPPAPRQYSPFLLNSPFLFTSRALFLCSLKRWPLKGNWGKRRGPFFLAWQQEGCNCLSFFLSFSVAADYIYGVFSTGTFKIHCQNIISAILSHAHFIFKPFFHILFHISLTLRSLSLAEKCIL